MSFQLLKEGNPRTGQIQGITCDGWTIKSKKAPICNSIEIDRFQKDYGIPPPEMIFGNNYVEIAKGSLKYTWNAFDALALVDSSASSGDYIKVSYAKEWSRKSKHQDVKDVVKPYDWTYTTTYKGTKDVDTDWERVDEPVIDVERLQQKEPILFYDENILYEDELADNGTAMLSIRLRVMPTCFLILQRFFLRVDDVLFRINDTRIFHEFGSSYLFREYTSKEDHYSNVRKKLEGNDIILLNDPNWVSSTLSSNTVTVMERDRLRI
ncbi:TIP41-like family-domain-containing protein [Halteromyces radiatus]|uniref:TIP41-like family-domain-containing protein n=1 Tax=Halteromyces radiatus TaxID=101107 RepID=UPI00221F3929|nr:TIP41-like family-domain-containing protein [Halteromyces radiatus]KAI8086377.1 TIP41-like family-domain-containing protein [Halteromyces radiatus]